MTAVEVRQASNKKSWNVLVDGVVIDTFTTKERATSRAIIAAHVKAPSTLATYQANGKVDDGFPISLLGPPAPAPPPPLTISRVHLVPGNAEIAPGGTVTFSAELFMSDGSTAVAPSGDFDWIEDEEFLDLTGVGIFEATSNAPDGFPLTVRAVHRASGLEDVAYLHVVAPPPPEDHTLAGRRIAASATSGQVGETIALDIVPVNAAGVAIPVDRLPSDWRKAFYFDTSDRTALSIRDKDGALIDRKPGVAPVFVVVQAVPASNPGSIFLQGGGYGLDTLPFTVTGAPAPPPPTPTPGPAPAPLPVEVEHIIGRIDPMSASDPAPWGPYVALFSKSEPLRYANHMARFGNGEGVFITNSHYDPEVARVQGEVALHGGVDMDSADPATMPGRGLVYIDQYERLYALPNAFNTPEQWSTCKKGQALMVVLHGDLDAREHIWFKAGRGTQQDVWGYWNMKSPSSGPRFIADLTEPIRFAHMLKIPYATPPRNGNGKPSTLFKSWREAYLWRSDVNVSLVGADGSMPSPAHGQVEVPFMSFMIVDELFEGYQFMDRSQAWLDTAVRMCQHLLDIWPAGKRTLPYLMTDVKEAPDLGAYAVRPFAIAHQLTGNVEFRDRALMTLGETQKAFITGSYDKQWNQVFGWARAWSAKRIMEGKSWLVVP